MVWYQGKIWLYEGLADHQGRISLVNIRDPSKGTSARPQDLRKASQAQTDAAWWWIEYFRKAATQPGLRRAHNPRG